MSSTISIRPRIYHVIVIAFCLFCASACIRYKRPVGEWYQSPDLQHTSSSLKGATIALDCGEGKYRETEWTKVAGPSCRQIAGHIQKLGASVVADESVLSLNLQGTRGQEPESEKELGIPDFTFVYIYRGTTTDAGGWTLLPCIITLTIFVPCVEDHEVYAELQIIDNDGLIVTRRHLELEGWTLSGAWALPALLMRAFNADLKRFNGVTMGRRLLTYIQNTVVTYHFLLAGSSDQLAGGKASRL